MPNRSPSPDSSFQIDLDSSEDNISSQSTSEDCSKTRTRTHPLPTTTPLDQPPKIITPVGTSNHTTCTAEETRKITPSPSSSHNNNHLQAQHINNTQEDFEPTCRVTRSKSLQEKQAVATDDIQNQYKTRHSSIPLHDKRDSIWYRGEPEWVKDAKKSEKINELLLQANICLDLLSTNVTEMRSNKKKKLNKTQGWFLWKQATALYEFEKCSSATGVLKLATTTNDKKDTKRDTFSIQNFPCRMYLNSMSMQGMKVKTASDRLLAFYAFESASKDESYDKGEPAWNLNTLACNFDTSVAVGQAKKKLKKGERM